MVASSHQCGWVVHGQQQGDKAIDELSIAGPTSVIKVTPSALREFEVTPVEAGLDTYSLETLQGADPASNADAIIKALGGEASPFLSAILLNAAAGLCVVDRVTDLKDGVSIAREAVQSGKALQTLEKLKQATSESTT